MLLVEGLTVHYGQVAAVRNVSLHVNEGEIVGLLGPNGAGKSTIVSAIVGLTLPSAGVISFEGNVLNGQPPERVIKRGIALVPEGRQVFASLTVRENLRLGTTRRRDRANIIDDLATVLHTFPSLEARLSTTAGYLSGGEQQQLAIARALLAKPRLILLDEPSLGLAPSVISSVFDSLNRIRSEGVTMLVVEQNAARAIDLADRCYVIRGGSITLMGTREELLATQDFVSRYLGV